jgi:hypothetical protein
LLFARAGSPGLKAGHYKTVGAAFPSQKISCVAASLARAKKLRYAGSVASGGFPPHSLSVVPVAIQFPVSEGWFMTRKNTWVRVAVALALSLPLAACKDTKTLQENEQLKAHVADVQKENGQLRNDLDAMTAARDELTKENEALKAEIKTLKTKHSGKKSTSHKHHRA